MAKIEELEYNIAAQPLFDRIFLVRQTERIARSICTTKTAQTNSRS